MHRSFLIKPASSACNLRCRYCFYIDESENRSVRNYGMMDEATAHALIDKTRTDRQGGSRQKRLHLFRLSGRRTHPGRTGFLP